MSPVVRKKRGVTGVAKRASGADASTKRSAKAAAPKPAKPRHDHKSSSSRAPAAAAASRSGSPRAATVAQRDTAAASRQIDVRIESLADWRGEVLARIRALIQQAVPGVVEEWKWRGVPVWSHAGILCTGESYKDVVKTTFAKGAALDDPKGLFNASLDGNTRRAIDFREGENIDAAAFKALVRAAASLNERSRSGARAATAKKTKRG